MGIDELRRIRQISLIIPQLFSITIAIARMSLGVMKINIQY
jgi:hypothetical protein